MKHILIALALCAAPAATFAQAVVCHACDHVAPYFRGEGGFIATVAEGVDEVTFVASCGSVSVTGEAEVHGDTASQLFSHRNGLACDEEDGSLEIAGLEDGGWYWVTDARNSAVGSLVSKDILDNETTAITSAGAGVSMTPGTGAVFLKEASTGRVGILPNILPSPPAVPPRKCGYTGVAEADPDGTRVNIECALGDGGALVVATSTNALAGTTVRIPDKGVVTRPAGSGSVVLLADLWGNGSGHYTTAPAGDPRLGHPEFAMSATGRSAARLTGVNFEVSLSDGGPGPASDVQAGSDNAVGGVSWNEDTNDEATISIAADSDYCSKTANHSATVVVTAFMGDANDAEQVTPFIARVASGANPGKVGSTSFTVVCP